MSTPHTHGNNPFGSPGPAPQPYAGVPAQPQYAAPGPQPYGMPACRFCGAQPAVETTIRAHRGYILAMSFRHTKAPFCRNCGLAEYRRMQTETLKFGWWSPLSVFLGPLTMLYNVVVPKRKLNALPAPGPQMPHQGY
ncbi:MAG: hypothetical protein HOV68_05555 [Streptomycetaceae bacterium]|nr:hypothetical protein [Streptomycetaceae bacterium]